MNPPNRLLIVVLDNLGDTVMATSLFRPLRRRFPAAEIGLWTKSYSAGLFDRSRWVNRVHAADPFWDRSPGRAAGRVIPFVSSWNQIRRAGYDAALLLNTEWRRAMAARLAGIPVRVGYDRRKSRTSLTWVVNGPDTSRHFVDDHRALAEAWLGSSLEGPEAVPFLEINPEEVRAAEDWLKVAGWVGVPLIAIHPFAGDVPKTWPLDRWEQVIRTLSARRPLLRFLVVCGPSEKERLAGLPERSPGVIRLLAGAPLGLVKALLARSKVFAGGDSGPGHVAAALGTSVVSLFGSTKPARCRPLGTGHLRVLSAEDVRDIPVGDVVEAIHAVL